jgi:predicted nucleic acid-binding protein
MTVVADTGAVYALLDARDAHHRALVEIFDGAPRSWVLPWAVLPEVDYLVATRLGARTAQAFVDDLAAGSFAVEWGSDGDLQRARAPPAALPEARPRTGRRGVMATAERLEAEAIATLDLRHFAAVSLRIEPRLLPRDAGRGRLNGAGPRRFGTPAARPLLARPGGLTRSLA